MESIDKKKQQQKKIKHKHANIATNHSTAGHRLLKANINHCFIDTDSKLEYKRYRMVSENTNKPRAELSFLCNTVYVALSRQTTQPFEGSRVEIHTKNENTHHITRTTQRLWL